MQFIILHGSFGAPDHNWFPWLKMELEKLGGEVTAPAFPIEDHDELDKIGEDNIQKAENQNLESWLGCFEAEVLAKLKQNERNCFIAHSISPVFLLHAVSQFCHYETNEVSRSLPAHLTGHKQAGNLGDSQQERSRRRYTPRDDKLKKDLPHINLVIFIAPFLTLPSINWQYDLVNSTFYNTDFDFEKIKAHIDHSYSIYSLNDPYVPTERAEEFAENIGSQKIPVEKQTHFSKDYKQFPLVLELSKTVLD